MIDDPTPLYPNDDLNQNNMCEQFKIDYWVNQRKSPTCNKIKYLNLKGQWPCWKAAIYLCHGPEDLSLSDWAKHLKEELESFIKWTKLYPNFYGAYKFHTIIEVKENLDGIRPLADVFQDETVVQIMRDLYEITAEEAQQEEAYKNMFFGENVCMSDYKSRVVQAWIDRSVIVQ